LDEALTFQIAVA